MQPDSPALFSVGTTPKDVTGPIAAYVEREAAETRLIALSTKVSDDIAREHARFFREQFEKFSRIPEKRFFPLTARAEASKRLPNLTEDAHYFVEMKFSILPWYVLMDHPDGQVKTTAWLTVLTSIFAMVMQFMYNGIG